jgi:hypothetical protein
MPQLAGATRLSFVRRFWLLALVVILALSAILASAHFAYGRGFAVGRKTETELRQYISRRKGILKLAAQDFPSGGVLILGDSITERAYLPTLCDRPVFNAGISFAGVGDIVDVAGKLIAEIKPSAVIIAIGVNDTAAGRVVDNDDWERDYRELLGAAKGIPVGVVGIMPVTGFTGYSRPDSADIKVKNQIISRIARQQHLAFAPPLGAISTFDGLHPDRTGYTAWRHQVALACPAPARHTA